VIFIGAYAADHIRGSRAGGLRPTVVAATCRWRKPFDAYDGRVPVSAKPTTALGRKPNRRSASTRQHVLEAALQLLATGTPEAVSVNLVAKQAGMTWGTVQYQFGDADGLWAAVVGHVIKSAGSTIWSTSSGASVSARVNEVIDLLWKAYDSPFYAATTNLRSTLARDRTELDETYPQTARALDLLDKSWSLEFARLFDNLAADPKRAKRVSELLPPAVRGLFQEHSYGSHTDIDSALQALRESATLYLNAPS
jgi:AcrR family transcriptional regulator